jgi:hypothetical protein
VDVERSFSPKATRDRRLKASSSWRDFFREFAIRLGFLAVLILVVWAASIAR